MSSIIRNRGCLSLGYSTGPLNRLFVAVLKKKIELARADLFFIWKVSLMFVGFTSVCSIEVVEYYDLCGLLAIRLKSKTHSFTLRWASFDVSQTTYCYQVDPKILNKATFSSLGYINTIISLHLKRNMTQQTWAMNYCILDPSRSEEVEIS